MLKETEHGKILLENGFEEDLKFCSKLNFNPAIPYFSANVLKLLQDTEPDAQSPKEQLKQAGVKK